MVLHNCTVTRQTRAQGSLLMFCQPFGRTATSASAELHVLTFSHFSLVCPQLRNLNVLDLRHISELNNETVMEVVRKCRNLSSLNLCLNWSINDRLVHKCGRVFFFAATAWYVAADTDSKRFLWRDGVLKFGSAQNARLHRQRCLITSFFRMLEPSYIK